MRLARSIFLAALAAALPASAASGAGKPVRVLMLSDVHFDPFAPTSRGGLVDIPSGAIEAGRETLRFPHCGPDEPTTTPRLFGDVLRELRQVPARFTVVTGDLVVHQLQCRFQTLYPDATPAAYSAFAEKVVRHVLGKLAGATGGRPLIVALGNHDSGCGNYRRAIDDPFLARLAEPIARFATRDPAERRRIAASFADHGGYALTALPGLPHVGAAIVDTTPLSRQARDCDGNPRLPDAGALAWLDGQLAAHDRPTWLLGHIPPGIDVRATVGAGSAGTVVPFQQGDDLPALMRRHAARLPLALFGHTHMDEWRLFAGVPLRVTPAISPSSGNRPAITLGEVRADGTLLDYRVLTPAGGAGGRWRQWYDFRTAYGARAFDRASLAALLADHRGAPGQQQYRRLYDVGNADGSYLKSNANWKAYACATTSMDDREYARC